MAGIVVGVAGSGAGVPVQGRLSTQCCTLLLTGARPAYVRAALGGHHGDPGVVDWKPLCWPSANVAGLYLAPLLAENVKLAGGGQP
jgi:hypothetical protein